MIKPIIAIVLYILIFASCTEQKESFDLTNTYWISDISMDYEIPEFTPSLLFSIGEEEASIHSLGYEDALFKSKYWIEYEYLYLTSKEGPLMKIISKEESELFVSLLPGDTTKFNRVYKSELGRGYFINRFENKTLQVGMGNNLLAGVIHFTKDEALNFSNDIFEFNSKDQLELNFYRIPHGIGFTNSIPTLAMGKSMHANVISKPGEDIRVQNYFAGSLDVKDNSDIGITIYQNNRPEKWRLIKVEQFEQARDLLYGSWGAGQTMLEFKVDGLLEYTEKGVMDSLSWKLDPSGHLIIITKKDGSKVYAVHNLVRDKNRIGFEFSRGRFKDLIRLK